MLLHEEEWMDLRAYRALKDAGATWAEIARESGHDWRTVKRYLGPDAPARPPRQAPRPAQPKLIDAYAHVIDAMLANEPRLRASVIHERLVADHGFAGSYQRVKLYVAARRPVIAPPPQAEFFERFEVLPGAQAQVDWGDEGTIETASGSLAVYSFHMTLAHSRDPFCAFVARQDLATFYDCHRRAFAHFGGVPAEILYDRTKTVVRHHVGRGQDTPLHPEAVAFAGHYGFAIRLAAPRRPQTKGRVERQVEIVRTHVLAGRRFASLAEMDAAFAAWLPIRRAQVHRTHGEVIASRAALDRGALGPLPAAPYLVVERHQRRLHKDALLSFETSLYSVPWWGRRPGERLELRVSTDEVAIWTTGAEPEHLATHRRSRRKGAWVIDPAHRVGLPAGGSRRLPQLPPCDADAEDLPPELARLPWVATTTVARRDLASYDRAVGQ
jgi:transposase